MQIAHISDLHIVAAPGPVGLVRADAVARAEALIRDLNNFEPRLDLVIISGDTVNDAREDEYRVLARLLATLRIPYVVVPGNHDDRALLRALAGHQSYVVPDLMYHGYDCGHVRVLALDTLSTGEIGGRLHEGQLGWLAGELARPFQGQTLIVMHHPPCKPRLGRLDGATLLEGQAELEALLDNHAGPVTILCGHMHRPFNAFLGRTLVSAAISTAFEFALCLDAPQEPPVHDAPYHYVIHAFDDLGGHATHRRTPTF